MFIDEETVSRESELTSPQSQGHNVMGGGGVVAKLCSTLVTPWIAAHQAPLSVGFLQARILEWGGAISSSRGSS